MNFIEKFISTVSPIYGLKRLQAIQAANYLRKFEGAAKTKRTTYWNTDGNSVNTENEPALKDLRERSRDLVRNNPYASRSLDVLCSNIIGEGIIPQSKHQSESVQKKIEELWYWWGETTKCDFYGQHDFYGLQSLITRTVLESGEALVRIVVSPENEFVPLKLQVLEPDFINTDAKAIGSNYVISGKEFDRSGKCVAIHLFEEHPGGKVTGKELKSIRVPSDQVLHVLRIKRPGQVRGIPVLSPVVIRLRDYDDFLDAILMKQKISACFAAFIRKTDSISETTTLYEKIEPGSFQYLNPGEDVTIANPPGVEGIDIFSRNILQSIAVGIGITYEALTGDYGNVNFSSGRMGWIEFHRNIKQWRSDVIIPQLLNPIWEQFIKFASIKNGDISGGEVTWTAPRREMIDPTKEVEANKSAVESLQTSLSEVIREQGKDPIKVFEEISKEREQLKNLGISIVSNSQKGVSINENQNN